MATYHINLEGDVLRVKFGKPADGDQIVQDAAARLNELIASGDLGGGMLLKIDLNEDYYANDYYDCRNFTADKSRSRFSG